MKDARGSSLPIDRSWMSEDSRGLKWNFPYRMYKAIVTLHGTPEDIALGTALGFFVAFTPTLGLQIIISLVLATCLGANRAAAFVPIWITNVFTAVPIYGFAYLVGSFFWTGPSAGEVWKRLEDAVAEMANYSFYQFDRQFEIFLELGLDIIIPMTIGGCVIGLVFAVIFYPLTLRAVRRYRLHHPKKGLTH